MKDQEVRAKHFKISSNRHEYMAQMNQLNWTNHDTSSITWYVLLVEELAIIFDKVNMIGFSLSYTISILNYKGCRKKNIKNDYNVHSPISFIP